jgi:hypothetical protein
LPAFLASDSPMAMACFLLVTFLPLRPDLSVPFFLAFISVSTLLLAAGEYFRPDDFLAELFLFVPLAFFALLFFTALFLELLFLCCSFSRNWISFSCFSWWPSFVLLGNQMAGLPALVVWNLVLVLVQLDFFAGDFE